MRSFFLKMLNQLLTVGMGKEVRLALAKDALAHPAMLTELILLVRSGSNVQRMIGAWVLSGIHALSNEVWKIPLKKKPAFSGLL